MATGGLHRPTHSPPPRPRPPPNPNPTPSMNPPPPPSPPAAAASGAPAGPSRFATTAAAYEKGRAHWARVAALPDIAAALRGFDGEPETRPKAEGRLDLVSWVTYVCAFGCPGPTRDVWNALLHACCFGRHYGDGVLALAAEEVAVLLAFSKCAADVSDNDTDHQVVKRLVRPAVEGRSNQARTPGILKRVREVYDDFVYQFVGRGFVENAKSTVDLNAKFDHGTRDRFALNPSGTAPRPPTTPAETDAALAMATLGAPGAQGASTVQGIQPPSPPPPQHYHNFHYRQEQQRTHHFYQPSHHHQHQEHHRHGHQQQKQVHAHGDHHHPGYMNGHLPPPSSLQPALPPIQPPAESVHTREDALHLVHDLVVSVVKEWELVVCEWLSLDPRAPAPADADPRQHQERLGVLHERRAETRTQLRDTFFRKLSARAWRNAPSPPLLAAPRNLLVPPHNLLAHVPHHTRQPRFSGDSDHSSFGSACSGASSSRLSMESGPMSLCSVSTLSSVQAPPSDSGWLVARAFVQAQSSIYTDFVRAGKSLQSSNVCGAFRKIVPVTVLELHVPGGPMSQSGLEWLPEDSIDQMHQPHAFDLYPVAPRGHPQADYSRRAAFWLADPDSGPGHISIPGAPPSSRCRGLQLMVEVSEIPPDSAAVFASHGSHRRFRFTRIVSAQWVELSNFGDSKKEQWDYCQQIEPKSDLENDDPDELEQGDSPESIPGVASSLASGVLASFVKIGHFNSSRSFPVTFKAPKRRNRCPEQGPTNLPGIGTYCPSQWPQHRMEQSGEPAEMDVEMSCSDIVGCTTPDFNGAGQLDADSYDDGEEETIKAHIEIDCSVVARANFVVGGGVENVRIGSRPDRNLWDMPVWRSRAP